MSLLDLIGWIILGIITIICIGAIIVSISNAIKNKDWSNWKESILGLIGLLWIVFITTIAACGFIYFCYLLDQVKIF